MPAEQMMPGSQSQTLPVEEGWWPWRASAGGWAEGPCALLAGSHGSYGKILSPSPRRGAIQLTEESGQVGPQVQRDWAVLGGHLATPNMTLRVLVLKGDLKKLMRQRKM